MELILWPAGVYLELVDGIFFGLLLAHLEKVLSIILAGHLSLKVIFRYERGCSLPILSWFAKRRLSSYPFLRLVNQAATLLCHATSTNQSWQECVAAVKMVELLVYNNINIYWKRIRIGKVKLTHSWLESSLSSPGWLRLKLKSQLIIDHKGNLNL